MLYRAFVFLAAATTALSLLSLSACSSLTRPDDIVIVAEPPSAAAVKAQPAKPMAPSPPTAPVRGAAPGAAMGAPAPAVPAVPNGCGG